jgi:hypothetical protein
MKSEFLDKLSQSCDDTLKKSRERKDSLLNMRMISNCQNLLKMAEEKCAYTQLLTLMSKVSRLRDETRDRLEEIKKCPMKMEVQVKIDKDFEDCVNCKCIGHLVLIAEN